MTTYESTLRTEMRTRGITVTCGHTVTEIHKAGNEFVTQLSDNSTIKSDKVMFAIGRHPNVSGFGLETLNVKIHEHGGIEVDEYSRTSMPPCSWILTFERLDPKPLGRRPIANMTLSALMVLPSDSCVTNSSPASSAPVTRESP